MGYSRERGYRFKELYDAGGAAALQELSRHKPNLKNRGAPEVEEVVCGIALEQPAWGQLRAAKAWAERGIPISAAGVRWGGGAPWVGNPQYALTGLGSEGRAGES